MRGTRPWVLHRRLQSTMEGAWPGQPGELEFWATFSTKAAAAKRAETWRAETVITHRPTGQSTRLFKGRRW